jgi:hypothetical protein
MKDVKCFILLYKIISKIPFDSHLKKTIGYLHAIHNGAKFIYETEDDHLLNDGLFTFKYEKLKGLTQNCQNRFTNPFLHFGQPVLVPRGLPSTSKVENCERYSIYSDKVPVIQHGLVEGSIDTFKSDKKIFDSNTPALVLIPGIYAPFSSRNTLFHYNVFWALLQPPSVDAQISDIYRDYLFCLLKDS